MDDKKKKYIIIGAVVLVVLYFVWKSNQNSEDDGSEGKSLKKAAESLNSGLATVGTAVGVQKTAEDEEYQNLLQELKTLNGGVLPSGATTLTTAQLKTQIKNVKALQEAYLKYADEETDESKQLTMEQLQEQGKGTLAAIQQLTREVEQRKQTEHLQELLEAFIKTCNNYGSIWHPAGAPQQTWDTSTLRQIMALSDSELKQLNSMVKARSKDLNYPDNYSALSYRYYERTSLSNAIPNGTLCKYRSGSSVAQEFKKNMADRGF